MTYMIVIEFSLILDFHLTRLRDIKLAGKSSSLSVGVRVFLKEISA